MINLEEKDGKVISGSFCGKRYSAFEKSGDYDRMKNANKDWIPIFSGFKWGVS